MRWAARYSGLPAELVGMLAGSSAGLLLSLSVAPELSAQSPTTWTATSYEVDFEIRNAGLPVHGSFETLEADVSFDPNHLDASRIAGTIDPASVQTGITLRDRHLAGRQFFDVRRFPSITMVSTALERENETDYRGTFDLTIRDQTKPVAVVFSFDAGSDQATMSGSLTINRVDFGVGDAGFLLSDEVTITVRLELAPALD